MIVQADDPILLQVCAPVAADFDVWPVVEELRAALEWSRLNGRPGDGLAAPQIGIALQVFIVKGYPPFVNPRITGFSRESEVKTEGCLSLPERVRVDVERPRWVKAVNGRGSPSTIKLRDWSARVFLHEYDHLQGILCTDRAQAKKR